MKIVVIGGSGLIGSKLVPMLREHGHEAVAASPRSGVNTLTGEGLDAALEGASVVVDVSNAPSWEDAAVMHFFDTSTRNIIAAETRAGVAHHVALSVVGSERLPESGYFRAKIEQERLIAESGIPYSIVRATQFFEFVSSIAASFVDGETYRVSDALIQPILSDDVAAAMATVAEGTPVNGMVEVGGPDTFRFEELIRLYTKLTGDTREVVVDSNVGYFGEKLSERTIVADNGARLGQTRYEDWLAVTAQRAASG